MRSFLIVVAVLAPAVAGCVIEAPPETESSIASGGASEAVSQRDVQSDASMSAHETVTESTGPCESGSSAGGLCAERRILVTGSLAHDALDVDLTTFNGGVKVFGGDEGEWSLDARLRARGETEAEAKRYLSNIAFTWSHTDEKTHFVGAKASLKSRSSEHGEGASIVVVVPASILTEITAQTTNGGIDVSNVRAHGIVAHTTNGGIDLDAEAVNVNAKTTNGGIEASIRTTSSGSLGFETTNGGVAVSLEESENRGYDVAADTTNGGIEIGLSDGTRSGEKGHQSFKTNGFETRSIRSSVRLESTNGGIFVNS